MVKRAVCVNEFSNQMVLGITVYIVLFVVFWLVLDYSQKDEKVFWLSIFSTLFLLTLFISSRNLGNVRIYRDYVYSTLPLLRQRCVVDITKEVYYIIFVENYLNYAKKYIVISNKPIVINGDDLRIIKIDNSSQIKIPFNKRVQQQFPKRSWTESGVG